MKNIQHFFESNGGYASMKSLKEASFHSRDIAKLTQEGFLEKIKPGTYRLSDISINGDENVSFVDICTAIPKAVICLASSLYMHELSTFCPSENYIAVPHNTRIPKISYPPIKVFYFNEKSYSEGIETLNAKYGSFRAYGIEKTICDMFKFRKKIGEELAIEGLQNYTANKTNMNLNKLMHYAEICRVKAIMSPYVKAMLR